MPTKKRLVFWSVSSLPVGEGPGVGPDIYLCAKIADTSMGMIHKEGKGTLSLVGGILVAVNLGLFFFMPNQAAALAIGWVGSLVLFLFFLQFFRNPKRSTEAHANDVLAPADGKIVVIEKVYEGEYLKAEALQISIFMSPVNVHVNRSPLAAAVEYFKYHPGKYLVAWHPKSSEENERTTLVIRTQGGTPILLRQIAGALARRIVCYARPGDALAQGQEFGFIKFGSRVDVFLPLDAQVTVQLGQVTRGAETVLATLSSE